MADVNTPAATETKKRRKASGPRKVRPTYLVISYTDESGQPVELDQNRLKITGTKDTSELVKMLTAKGVDRNSTFVMQLDIADPAPTPRAPAAATE